MIELDGDPEERLKDAITSPYDIEDSDLEALLIAISNQFDDIENAREDVYDSKFIETATGHQLDKLASIGIAQSKRNEPASEFRQRIKAGLRSQLASGTHDDILELTAVVLDIDNNDIINIEEQRRSSKPSFSVKFPVDELGGRDLNTASLDPILNEVSAAGVRATSQVLGNEAAIRITAGSTFGTTNNSDAFTPSLSTTTTQTKQLNNNGLSSDLLEPLSHSPSGFVLSGGPPSSTQITITVADTTVSAANTTSQFEPRITGSEPQNTTRSAKALSSSELEPLSQTGWSISNT